MKAYIEVDEVRMQMVLKQIRPRGIDRLRFTFDINETENETDNETDKHWAVTQGYRDWLSHAENAYPIVVWCRLPENQRRVVVYIPRSIGEAIQFSKALSIALGAEVRHAE